MVALLRQPDTVAPLAVTRHQHIGPGGQAVGLLHQKSVGFGAVFEAGHGEILIPEVLHAPTIAQKKTRRAGAGRV